MTWSIYTNFGSPFPRRLHRILALIGQALSEKKIFDQRTNGPVNAHLISWPSKAQNIQNLENIL